MTGVLDVAVRFRLQEWLDDPEKGMSQSKLAKLSGVSLATVNAIANNRTSQVSLATLDALSAALGLEPGELLERDEPKRKRGR
jgi:transcriptional regulator with XRE-family HTH domain